MSAISSQLSENQNSRRNFWHISSPLLLNCISFVILFEVLFGRNLNFLFYGLDGSYILVMVKEQFSAAPLQIGFVNNFLQGLGNIWFPLNARLIPGYIALHSVPEQISLQTSYTVFALELFVATLLAGRLCKLSWLTSVAAAWLLPFLAFPVIKLPAMYLIMALVPSQATTIMVMVVAVTSFSAIGTGTTKRTTLTALAFLACIIYILASQPTAIMLMTPVITLFCLFSLVGSQSRGEWCSKVVASCCILGVLALGPIQFALGIFTYSAPYFFAQDFVNDRMTLSYASIAFHGKAGTWLFVCAALGAGVSLFSKKGKGSVATLATAVSAMLVLAIGLIAVNTEEWRGPSPIYFEFMLWPFYAVFAVEMIRLFGRWILRAASNMSKHSMIALASITDRRGLALLAVIPWLCLLLPAAAIGAGRSTPYPPHMTEIVETLRREIALVPGERFRGRVATFTGLTDLASRETWLTLHHLDHWLIKAVGNDHRMVGLWYYDIPTIFEYSPLLTPAFHSFGKKFLALPQDGQIRNVLTLRNPQEKFLLAMGVRFIVTDSPISGPTLRVTLPVPNFGVLYLYELPLPNLGHYSPDHPHVAKSLKEVLEILGGAEFDFRKDFVLQERLDIDLVSASDATFYADGRLLRIKASSKGYSMLLLPLEYSHCIRIEEVPAKQHKSRLVRVNLMQTGVLFERSLDATLRYFTGPFNNSSCRSMDSDEFKQLVR